MADSGTDLYDDYAYSSDSNPTWDILTTVVFIFFAVILVGLLGLIIYLCWRRRRVAAASIAVNIVAGVVQGRSPLGLDAVRIIAMPTHVFPGVRPEGYEARERDVDCAICLEEFAEGEEVKLLPCNHIFHGACIDRWLANRAACPKCWGVVGP